MDAKDQGILYAFKADSMSVKLRIHSIECLLAHDRGEQGLSAVMLVVVVLVNLLVASFAFLGVVMPVVLDLAT